MRRTCIGFVICIVLSSFTPGFGFTIPSIISNASLPENNLASTDQIWSMTHGSGPRHSAFYAITSCREGGFTATGDIWFQGRRSLLLVRIDENGGIIWQRVFQEFPSQVGRDVIECQSGGFAIIGEVSENNGDALLVRIDATGSILWFRTYGGFLNYDQGLALVECQSGGFAFTGSTIDANRSNSDFWLVRTDAQGTFLWNRFYGGHDDEFCHAVIETVEETLVLAGSTESFGGGNEDAWILQTTSMGEMVWNITYGGLRPDVCFDIIQTSMGNYIFVSESENTPNQISDGFAASIIENGNIQWSTTFGGTSQNIAYAVTECIDGTFGVTGRTIVWDGDRYFPNLWLVRFDDRGEYLWGKSYGGTDVDEGRSILQTINGDFVIAGMSESLVEEGMSAWAIRVPDSPPPPVDNRIYGPVNFFLISLGIGLACLILFGSYLLFHRSRKEVAHSWS